MKHIARFFFTCILMVAVLFSVSVKPAFAMEFRSSDTDVVITENELVAGSLFTSGSTVEIDGAIEGDLFCVGQTIVIKGTVGGDVICAGQTIQIDGVVDGNIRVAGQMVTIAGQATRNATILGQTLTLSEESMMVGDVIAGGQTLSFLGDIGKSIMAAGQTVMINGTVAEDAKLEGNVIQLGEAAFIGGTLTYISQKDAIIASTAEVTATEKKILPKETPKKEQKSEEKNQKWPLKAVGTIFGYLIVGFISVLLFRGGVIRITEGMKRHAGGVFGWGVVWFTMFPAALLFLICTVVGIPVAVLYVFVFVALLVLSKLFTALFIGREILTAMWRRQKDNWYGAVLVGVPVVFLLSSVPLVGWLVSVLAVLFGAGGFVRAVVNRKSSYLK